jgi:hypothetical protein
MPRTAEQKAERLAYDSARRAYLRDKQKEYRRSHPEQTRACQKRSYEKNKALRLAWMAEYNARPEVKKQKRARNLVALYGITLQEYEAILAVQNGVCAVCGGPEISGRQKHLSVDHDHKTGAVRGLVCIGCNSALGLVGEDKARLLSLLSYIERHGG